MKGPGLAVYTGMGLAGAPGRPPPLHGQEGHTGPSEQWRSPETKPGRQQPDSIPKHPLLGTDTRGPPHVHHTALRGRHRRGCDRAQVCGGQWALEGHHQQLCDPRQGALLGNVGQWCCLLPAGTRMWWGAVNRSTTPGTPGESEHHRGLVRAQLDQAGGAAVHLALCKALESGVGALCVLRAFSSPTRGLTARDPEVPAANPAHAACTPRAGWARGSRLPWPRGTVNSRSASPSGQLPGAEAACPRLPPEAPQPPKPHTYHVPFISSRPA